MSKKPLPDKFTLMKRAKAAHVLDGADSFLIAAPTATGKSKIGRDAIVVNLPKKISGTVFLYLVPFKALAEEIALKFQMESPNAKVAISNSDYNKPFDPEDTDIVVATYERAIGLLNDEDGIHPTIVVADEFNYVGDMGRGPQIESLLSSIAREPNIRLIALSAVLTEENAKQIANWLKLELILGTEKDRPSKLEIVKCDCDTSNNQLLGLLPTLIEKGNVIVFCRSRREAESCARKIAPIVKSKLDKSDAKRTAKLKKEFNRRYPYLIELTDRIEEGVSFHHAGLEADLRKDIVNAFNERSLKVLCATPTLSAGVNVPARSVILKDITRFSGRSSKLLSVSETINMLGRAGRPGLDSEGTSFLLIPKSRRTVERKKETDEYVAAVLEGKPEPVQSRIPDSSKNIQSFILGTLAKHSGLTRDDLKDIHNMSLWAHSGGKIDGTIPTSSNLLFYLSDRVPRNPRVKISMDNMVVTTDTLTTQAGSKTAKDYHIWISSSEVWCSCLGFKFKRNIFCKHLESVIYECLQGEIAVSHPDATTICMALLKNIGIVGDPAYQLAAGLQILLDNRFAEEDEDGFLHATDDGRRVLITYKLSYDHIRVLRDRISSSSRPESEEEVIKWAFDNYSLETDPEKIASGISDYRIPMDEDMQQLFWRYLNGESYRAFIRARKQVQKFLDAKDQVEEILETFNSLCRGIHEDWRSTIRDARRRVSYGCSIEFLPLMVLRLDEIKKAEAVAKLVYDGIENVHDLSRRSEKSLANLVGISITAASHLKRIAKTRSDLINRFRKKHTKPRQDPDAFNTLAIRCEMMHDDLVDYYLE